MERHHLICGLIGFYVCENHYIKGEDLSYKINNMLIDSKFTPLGTEDGDLQLLDEMIAEFTMSVIGRGFNRKDRRSKKY